MAGSGGKGQIRESSGEEKWLSHLGLPSSEQRGMQNMGYFFFFLIFIYLAMPSCSASTWDL